MGMRNSHQGFKTQFWISIYIYTHVDTYLYTYTRVSCVYIYTHTPLSLSLSAAQFNGCHVVGRQGASQFRHVGPASPAATKEELVASGSLQTSMKIQAIPVSHLRDQFPNLLCPAPSSCHQLLCFLKLEPDLKKEPEF